MCPGYFSPPPPPTAEVVVKTSVSDKPALYRCYSIIGRRISKRKTNTKKHNCMPHEIRHNFLCYGPHVSNINRGGKEAVFYDRVFKASSRDPRLSFFFPKPRTQPGEPIPNNKKAATCRGSFQQHNNLLRELLAKTTELAARVLTDAAAQHS